MKFSIGKKYVITRPIIEFEKVYNGVIGECVEIDDSGFAHLRPCDQCIHKEYFERTSWAPGEVDIALDVHAEVYDNKVVINVGEEQLIMTAASRAEAQNKLKRAVKIFYEGI